MFKPVLYFDHAATTCLYSEVINLLSEDFTHHFANPSSTHRLGHDLSQKITSIKSIFLNSLNANFEDNFYFTSSATESNNTIINGLNLVSGDVVLYSKADHPSVVFPIENLKEKNIEVISLRLLKSGQFDFSFLEDILSKKNISMVVLTQVNHQSGNMYDVKKIAELIKKFSPKAHVHIDAVQAYGKIKTDVSKQIDSMSITAHKIGGPKGIAGLYLKKNHRIKPLFVGGGQQSGFRAGTENYPLVNAFREAAQISLLNLSEKYLVIDGLKRNIEEHIKKNISQAMFPFTETSPYILTFIIPGISTDIILRHLEMKNIFIGTTSACSGRIKAFNPTLAALDIPEKFHKNILRISLGPSTNQHDTSLFINEFLATWKELSYFIK